MRTKTVTVLETHKDLFKAFKTTKPAELWVRCSGGRVSLAGSSSEFYELDGVFLTPNSYTEFLTACLDRAGVRLENKNFQLPDPEDDEEEDWEEEEE